MATFHLSQSIGHAGKAGPHAAYIARLGEYAPGKAKGKGLQDFEAGGSGNMPAWAASNPLHFWRAADAGEIATGATYRLLLDDQGRKVLDDDGKPVKVLQKNVGQAYKEIELALPRELDPAQRLALVEAWIAQEISDKHAFTFAIHCPRAKLDDGEQPHLHLMYSERLRDGIERDPAQYFKRYRPKNPAEGGAKKAASSKTVDENKAELCERRERWATMLNQHLEAAGFDARVDHRSNVARGIVETPERHFGPNASDSFRAAVAAERIAKTSRRAEVEATALALEEAQAEFRALLTQRAQESVVELVPVPVGLDAGKRAEILDEARQLLVEQKAAKAKVAVLQLEFEAAEVELVAARSAFLRVDHFPVGSNTRLRPLLALRVLEERRGVLATLLHTARAAVEAIKARGLALGRLLRGEPEPMPDQVDQATGSAREAAEQDDQPNAPGLHR